MKNKKGVTGKYYKSNNLEVYLKVKIVKLNAERQLLRLIGLRILSVRVIKSKIETLGEFQVIFSVQQMPVQHPHTQGEHDGLTLYSSNQPASYYNSALYILSVSHGEAKRHRSSNHSLSPF